MSEISISSDRFEANNSIDTAVDLGLIEGVQELSDLTLTEEDEDWFEFELNATGNDGDYLEVSFEHDSGDIDLELYDAEGNLVDFSNSINDFERISLAGFPQGVYSARIYGYQGSANPQYSLSFNTPGADAYESNDTIDTASDLSEVTGLNVYENLSIDSDTDIDLFNFTLTEEATDNHYVSLDFDHSEGDLDVELYDGDLNLLDGSYEVTNREEISLSGYSAGNYLLYVYGYDGAVNSNYTMTIQAPGVSSGDEYEANNTLATATYLNELSAENFDGGELVVGDDDNPLSIHTAGDEDWYKLTLATVGQDGHLAGIVFDSTLGDLDLELYDATGSEPIDYSNSVDDFEAISLEGLAAGDYYLRVFGYNNAINPDYQLYVDAPWSPVSESGDEYEANNSLETATDLGVLTREVSLENLSIHTDNDVDWYKFTLESQGDLNNSLGINFNHNQGDLDLAIYNEAGNLIDTSESIGNLETFSLAGYASGTYYLKVYGYSGAVNSDYNLFINPPLSGAGDWSETNDTAETAYSLPNIAGLKIWENPLSIDSAEDRDWFEFTLGQTGTAEHGAVIAFNRLLGDLDLALYNEAGEVLDSSESTDNYEYVSFDGLSAGTYRLQVFGYNGAVNPAYYLGTILPGDTAGDWAESNDTQDTAYSLGNGETPFWSDLSIHAAGDEDWFKFTTSEVGTAGHSVSINFNHELGDLDLVLIDPEGNAYISQDVTNQEVISLEGLPAGEYFAQVYGYNGATNPNYNLTIDVPAEIVEDWAESNNSLETATDLRSVDGSVLEYGLNISSDDRDWFKFQLNSTGSSSDTASIFFNHEDGDLDIALYDSEGNQLGTSEGVGNSEEISLSGLEADTYYLQVYGYEGTINPDYSLAITGAETLEADNLEPNDTPADAYELRDVSAIPGNKSGGYNYSWMTDMTPYLPSVSYGTPPPFIYNFDYSPQWNQPLFSSNQLGGGLNEASIGNSIVNRSLGLTGPLSDPYYQASSQFINQEIARGNPSFLRGALNFAPNPTSTEINMGLLEGNQGLYGSAADFDLTYNLVSQLFGASNTPSLFFFPDSLSIHTSNDRDWFSFNLSSDGEEGQFVEITFDNEQGDLQLELFEGFDSDLPPEEYQTYFVDRANGSGDSEQISLEGLATGDYYVRVSGVDGATNPNYNLILSAPPQIDPNQNLDPTEPNDSADAPYDLRAVDGRRDLADLAIHETGDEDWFKFETNATGQQSNRVRIDFNHSRGDLDLVLYDSDNNEIARSESTDDSEEISLEGLEAGTYQARVFGYNGATNPNYSLSILAPETEINPDSWEPNNSINTALNLSNFSNFRSLSGLTIHTDPERGDDEDYFQFDTNTTATNSNSVSIEFARDLGDLQLELYREGEQSAISQSTSTANGATISLNGLEPDTYYARVLGNGEAVSNRYQFYLDAPLASNEEQQNDWTVMVYATASDLEGSIFRDINEMELATSFLPSNVNFSVLWDQSAAGQTYGTGGSDPWGTTGRAIIQPDSDPDNIATTFELLDEQNTGDATTLTNFIDWTKNTAPAENYALILWDHGDGVLGGFNHDNLDGEAADTMFVDELVNALDSSDFRPDLFAFDACFMGMTEVSYALSDYSDVFVASEEVISSDFGYDYSTAFSSLQFNANTITAEELASDIVSNYQGLYWGSDRGWDTLSAVDTEGFDNLTSTLNNFTTTVLSEATSADWTLLQVAREAAASFHGSPYYRDLGQFMIAIADSSVNPDIASAAREVKTAIDSIVIAQASDSRDTDGLSIYLPENGSAVDGGYLDRHEAFFTATGWSDFLDRFVTQETETRSGLTVDWAESNGVAARAYNLHTLVGDGHNFDNLSLHDPSDVDWFRFRITETGTQSDRITLNYDNSNNANLTIALYQSQDGTRQEIQSSDNNSISLAELAAGEYSIQVRGSATVAEYSLAIDAPGAVSSGEDWAKGNNRQSKAHNLGVIAGENRFSGLNVAPDTEDWFEFANPRNKTDDSVSRTVTVNIAGDSSVNAELRNSEGEVIDSATGSEELELIYPEGAAQTYQLKVNQTDDETPASYSLNFEAQAEIPPEITPEISIGDSSVVEGNEGVRNCTFNITLNEASSETVTVDYATSNGTALAGEDYRATEGTLTFASGETTKTITVEVFGDAEVEDDESFTVNLSNPNNATIADNRGNVVLENDDIAERNLIELYRFRNTTFSSGTYIFVGEAEKDSILGNPDFNQTFELEGVQEDGSVNTAFIASLEADDDLIPFYRLRSLDVPGTYLFVSTAEYEGIFANDSDQNDKWVKEGTDDRGDDIPEFYLYDGSADSGVEFHRFQNTQNNTFLYAGPSETAAINDDDNLSALFNDQGTAFESFI